MPKDTITSALTTMSLWSLKRYGGPDQLVPITRVIPVPKPDEVLICVKASAVTRADGMMRAGKPKFARLFLGLKRPKSPHPGTGVSGEVIAVGAKVSRFAPGDLVFGETGLTFSGNATHVCVPESGVLMPKPLDLNHQEAAVMCDGPLTSYNFLTEIGQARAGQRVLIIGASGSLGSAAVQVAAQMGLHVTGTCSTRNVEMVTSLGADRVLDYTQQDFTQMHEKYDVIYDTLGISNFGQARVALTMQGRYISPVLSLGLLGAMLKTSWIGQQKACFSATGLKKPDELREMLNVLLDMVVADTMRPVIDRTYPLSDLPEAHTYMETGRKRGNVVVV